MNERNKIRKLLSLNRKKLEKHDNAKQKDKNSKI